MQQNTTKNNPGPEKAPQIKEISNLPSGRRLLDMAYYKNGYYVIIIGDE